VFSQHQYSGGVIHGIRQSGGETDDVIDPGGHEATSFTDDGAHRQGTFGVIRT